MGASCIGPTAEPRSAAQDAAVLGMAPKVIPTLVDGPTPIQHIPGQILDAQLDLTRTWEEPNR